ncbi:MAG: DsbC family protein [Gammaproteobacteria bacterium]|nr:DsbC family protein [Gammaproteobacteria bacterium]MDH4313821.1 DsbC family protein [Gammaproteobacteria bacterium]MDH5214822.1 DsbC family protein [Gammaproteobacteria bacterium]MDH5500548.1 DsbC family protein [Gammaproteobacteria bacterium]
MKIFKALTVIAGITLASAVSAVMADELDEVRERVSERFAEIEPKHVSKSPVDGWYTVNKGAIVAYISADGRYLLQGDLIDLELQTNLSEESRNGARIEMMSEVPREKMIIFSPEEVRFSVSIFTDIDCTYCRRLHSQIGEYMAQGIEIKYLLYPRGGPTSESWVKAEQVWCADNRNDALTLAKLDRKFETHSCDSSVVSQQYAIGQDVGLRGTPAIVLEDGTLISGYMPAIQLAEALASASAK